MRYLVSEQLLCSNDDDDDDDNNNNEISNNYSDNNKCGLTFMYFVQQIADKFPDLNKMTNYFRYKVIQLMVFFVFISNTHRDLTTKRRVL